MRRYNIGVLLALLGGATEALQLIGAGAALCDTLAPPLSPSEQAQLESALAPVRQTLGPARADEIVRSGHTLSLGQAIALALNQRQA